MKKVLLFLCLTFSLSYTLAFAFVALGGRWNTPEAYLVGVGYMFVPMVVAVAVQKLYREPVKEPLGISWRLNRWWLFAWFLPPAVALATLGVSLLLPGVGYSPGMEGFFERFKDVLPPERLEAMKRQSEALPVHPFWLSLVQGLVAGITVNAVAGFGEELGWRGLLYRELSFLGFWRSSALIGAIWGIWHAPLILQGHNYPQHPVAGVFMVTAWCMLLSPIFSYVRLKAGSVVAAAVLHGSLNATSGLALMLVKGGSDLTVGVTGVSGFIVLGAVDFGICLSLRRR